MLEEQNQSVGFIWSIQSLTYFLLLPSELDVAFEDDGPVSSFIQAVCLLFPYKALGAELDRGMEHSWAEVGVVVAARTGRAFSAVGVL